MRDYSTLRAMLAVSFNSDDRLSLDAAKDLYARFAPEHPELSKLREELREAMNDPEASWREMLRTANYPMLDMGSEEKARAFATEFIAGPLLGDF